MYVSVFFWGWSSLIGMVTDCWYRMDACETILPWHCACARSCGITNECRTRGCDASIEFGKISLLVPSILQDLALSSSAMDNLRQIDAIIYGGGPLPPKAGDAIAAKTRLCNFMGSSEMGNLPTEDVDRQDWEYLKFSPKLEYQMRLHSDDLFELCFFRQRHLEHYQSVFSTFPDRQEYFSSDLYSQHSTKPTLWRYRGRADDILTLTNEEKVNPLAMESLIGAHPDVHSVLVVGQSRFQTTLLVEGRDPPLCHTSKERSIEKL